MPSSPLRLIVPASTSNLGAGFDALGVALGLKMEVIWTPSTRTRVCRSGDLAESTLPTGRDPVLRGMKRAALVAGKALPPGTLEVSADFQPGKGLGASGAGMVAGLLLGNRLLGGEMKTHAMLEEAIALEGHPENATASLLGGAHWSIPMEESGWKHLPIDLHRDLRFLLIIPPYSLETSRSRGALPAKVPFKEAVAQARKVPVLLEGLKTLAPDLLAEGLADRLHMPARLRLLAGAEPIIATANQAGALGATLSGAGSGILVLARIGGLRRLEAGLQRKVRRLWGKEGRVVLTRPRAQGATFL